MTGTELCTLHPHAHHPRVESGSVIKRVTKPEIMFTTCNLRFSAAERLLVFARLAGRSPVV